MEQSDECSNPENVLQKTNYFSVPVQITDLSSYNDAFSSMKERFESVMRKVEQEMTRFSTGLRHYYGQISTSQVGPSDTQTEQAPVLIETLTNSPLVEGEGNSKTLKLQFDVSQFAPDEIQVKVTGDVLRVSAVHEEKADSSKVYREYNRECLLPRGIDKEAIVSSLARDGVLTIQTPMPQLTISDHSSQRSS